MPRTRLEQQQVQRPCPNQHRALSLAWLMRLRQELTFEQKKSILNLLVADIDYDASISYFENFKGPICISCGKIRFPASYTTDEAINEVETSDEFLLLKFLESHLQL